MNKQSDYSSPVYGIMLVVMLFAIHHSMTYEGTINSNFNIDVPSKAQVVFSNHDVSIFGGYVSWLVRYEKPKMLLTSEYEDLKKSDENSSKYQEIIAEIKKLYPEYFKEDDGFKYYVDTYSGNSLIGISEAGSGDLMLFYKIV